MVNDVRLIDANSVVKDILWIRDNDLHVGYPRPYEQGAIRKALRCIEESKTIDAVPVVRCEDCGHCTWYTKVYHNTGEQKIEYWCTKGKGRAVSVEPNHFCSYGEQKDGDSDG